METRISRPGTEQKSLAWSDPKKWSETDQFIGHLINAWSDINARGSSSWKYFTVKLRRNLRQSFRMVGNPMISSSRNSNVYFFTPMHIIYSERIGLDFTNIYWGSALVLWFSSLLCETSVWVTRTLFKIIYCVKSTRKLQIVNRR